MISNRWFAAWTAVPVLVAAFGGCAQKPAPPPTEQVTQVTGDINEAIKIFNGVWKLEKRTNPDGSDFQQVQGTTTIELKPQPSKFGRLGDRALGTIHSEESGVYDPRCRGCVPDDVLGKKFDLESSGTWAVSLLAKTDAHAAGPNEFLIAISDSSRITGSFVPYIEGLNFQVTGVHRVSRGRGSAQLLNRVRFDNESPPKDNGGQPVPTRFVAAAS